MRRQLLRHVPVFMLGELENLRRHIRSCGFCGLRFLLLRLPIISTSFLFGGCIAMIENISANIENIDHH